MDAFDLALDAISTDCVPELLQRAATAVAETLEADLCEIVELPSAGTSRIVRASKGTFEVVARGKNQSSVLSGIFTGASVVLSTKEGPFGILSVYSQRRRAFTANQLRYLHRVGLTLSAAIQRAQLQNKAATPATEKKGVTKARLLIVDDDPLLVQVLEQGLHKEYEIVTTTDSREALRHILDQPSFDIILCDMMMPEMTGSMLYLKTQEARPGIEKRFIIMTGGASSRECQEFMNRPEIRRIDKPFTVRNIQELLKAHLSERHFSPDP